jgi:hypothetical protein
VENRNFFYATYTLEDQRTLVAKFENENDRDGFEISIGMYRANLGAITEDVFRTYAERFRAEVLEAE